MFDVVKSIIWGLFRRFEPRLIVLVDSELWPNLLHMADRRGIPAALVNARLSPRSARRYAKFKMLTGPMLATLKLVCAQGDEQAPRPQREALPCRRSDRGAGQHQVGEGIGAARGQRTGQVAHEDAGVEETRAPAQLPEEGADEDRGR